MVHAPATMHMHRVAPTKLSQVQAARAARVSRTTIYRAMKQGRLSAERDEFGNVHIDASELLRVFPGADLQRAHAHAPKDAPDGHAQPRAPLTIEELVNLHAVVEDLRADKLHLRAELERAAAEREHVAEERARAAEERTRLLTMLEEKDRQLAEQLQTVKLLTDARSQRKSWWRRWW
jgi:hypothetical protein